MKIPPLESPAQRAQVLLRAAGRTVTTSGPRTVHIRFPPEDQEAVGRSVATVGELLRVKVLRVSEHVGYLVVRYV